MGRSVWPGIMWFCSRKQVAFMGLVKPNYLRKKKKKPSESNLQKFPWEFTLFPVNQSTYNSSDGHPVPPPAKEMGTWVLLFLPLNFDSLHFDMHMYVQSGRRWALVRSIRHACFQAQPCHVPPGSVGWAALFLSNGDNGDISFLTMDLSELI